VFKALADASRRKLLDRLHGRNGQTLGELCEGLDMSRQAVTKHLRLMEGAGLLVSERQGRQVRWRGNPEVLGAAQQYLDRVAARWDGALGRLKAHVER